MYMGVRFVTVLLIGLSLLPSIGFAADGPARVVVLIVSQELKDRSEELVRAVDVQLADLPVSLRVERVDAFAPSMAAQEEHAVSVAEQHGAVAVVWCEFHSTQSVYFYLAAGVQERRVLVRHLGSQAEGDYEEAAAIMARASVSAILKGGEIGVDEREEKKEKTTETSPKQISAPIEHQKAEPAADRERLVLDAAYALQTVSVDHAVVQGGYLAVGARVRGPLRVYLGYTFQEPINDKQHGISANISRHPIRLGVSLDASRGRWTLGGALAVCLDVYRERYISLNERVVASPDDTRVGFSILPMFRRGFHVVGSFSLFASLGAEIPLPPIEYTVTDGDEKQVIFSNWPVQPSALIGVRAALF